MLKHRLGDSPTLMRSYAFLRLAAGRWHLSRGEELPAMEAYLRAWRVAGPELVGEPEIARCRGMLRRLSAPEDGLPAVEHNRLLNAFLHTREADLIRRQYAAFPVADRVRLRQPRENDDPERQGDLIVLKGFDAATGEKGVLLIKYTESIREMPVVFDLRELAPRYMIVLEPSSWGYQDSTFLFYIGRGLDVVVLSQCWEDLEFIRSLGSNLHPIGLGAGDWVDPAAFRPEEGQSRSYDLVMVSGWSPLKRHAVLFRALSHLKSKNRRRLRVALIGYPQGWTREKIEKLMRRYGVEGSCSIFESIPHSEVARIVADSKAYVLLSRREGANKALYESWFSNTPAIISKGHRGVNLDHVTSTTGVETADADLPEALLKVVDDRESFRPREWALANTGYENSTRILNDALRKIAIQQGLPWTRDIVGKKNAPELRYAGGGMWRSFGEEYAQLAKCMR